MRPAPAFFCEASLWITRKIFCAGWCDPIAAHPPQTKQLIS